MMSSGATTSRRCSRRLLRPESGGGPSRCRRCGGPRRGRGVAARRGRGMTGVAVLGVGETSLGKHPDSTPPRSAEHSAPRSPPACSTDWTRTGSSTRSASRRAWPAVCWKATAPAVRSNGCTAGSPRAAASWRRTSPAAASPARPPSWKDGSASSRRSYGTGSTPTPSPTAWGRAGRSPASSSSPTPPTTSPTPASTPPARCGPRAYARRTSATPNSASRRRPCGRSANPAPKTGPGLRLPGAVLRPRSLPAAVADQITELALRLDTLTDATSLLAPLRFSRQVT